MNSPWLSYLPYNVAADLLAHPGKDPVGRVQRFSAVALFADVSGFVRLSEALGRAGAAGTEELTNILNSYFAPMIDLIQSYGGIVGKFGGDSLSILFPFSRWTRTHTICRAVQCALDMQARMPSYAAIATSAGAFSLTMHAGMAIGTVLCTVVGHPERRLEYIIAGSLLDRAAEAERFAGPGDLVVHREVLEVLARADGRLSEREIGEMVRNGDRAQAYARISKLRRPAPRQPLPPLDTTHLVGTRSLLVAFHHPMIGRYLGRPQRYFINEHRRVTALFVRFPDFDYDNDSRVADRLQSYLSAVMGIIDRYDGYLRQVEMGDKGSKYIVLFGAPVLHEDDAERALRCALELSVVEGRPTSIGIDTGSVFCGLVGGSSRQEYAVVGDAVNMAARLMEAADPRQILVSERTRRDAGAGFVWDRREGLVLKGKTEPVPVAVLTGVARRVARLPAQAYALPMVGRTAELRQITELIHKAETGHGQVVGIAAEAGMGKSRLLVEAFRLANDRQLAVASSECLSYGTHASYLVWQRLLAELFGFDLHDSPEVVLDRLEYCLSRVEPSYVQRMPLLGVVLNLPIPETELTSALDPRMRKTSLEALVIDFIRRRALENPVMLVFEDCHWIDPLSHDLLEAVARSIVDSPVVMLLAYRPHETPGGALRVSRLGHFRELRLADLPPAEVERLIRLKLVHTYGDEGRQIFDPRTSRPLRQADPAVQRASFALRSALGNGEVETLVRRIAEQAQGNPLYIDEVVELIRERGIDPTSPGALHALEFPDSLHTLIGSRIDQLAEGPQTTLKVASVIGQTFSANWLRGVYPPLGRPARVSAYLDLLVRQELALLHRFMPEAEYLFKHPLIRDVAYERMSVATRAILHESTAQFIERTYPEGVERRLDLLAYHYGRSGNLAKQREYLHKAAETAQAAYANDAAIDYYQRLLPLLNEAAQIDVMLKLGEVWQVTGHWAEADRLYRRAMDLAERLDNRPSRAVCQHALGRVLHLRGDYNAALDWLGQAHDAFAALGDEAAATAVLQATGHVYARQGNYAGALECYEQYMDSAIARGDLRAIGQAIAAIGDLYFYQGDYALAMEYYERWLHRVAELGDLRQAGYTLSDMGQVYDRLGNPFGALFCFAQQFRIGTEIGDRRLVSGACGNMADVYRAHGDLDRALIGACHQLRLGLEIGDRVGVACALGDIAVLLVDTGRGADSQRLFEWAIARGRALHIPYELCEFLSQYASVCFRQGRLTEALALNDEAQAHATGVGRRDMQFQTQLLGLQLDVALGRVSTADAVQHCQRMLREWTDDTEQAALAYFIWRLDPTRDDARDAAIVRYRRLYTRTPSAESCQRYQELTGESLPTPSALADLPEALRRAPLDLDRLLAQVAQNPDN
jgi:class 3 adenylate cyclase/tetratricopeptide (TPR) repeat protein